MSLPHRAIAEVLGTAILLMAIVGSILQAGAQHAAGAEGLIGVSLAIGASFVLNVTIWGPVSGCHINPAVTLGEMLGKRMSWHEGATYILAQLVGGVIGVALADGMFNQPLIGEATAPHMVPGINAFMSEIIATAGLVAVVQGCGRYAPDATKFALPAWIVAASWFTASTCFANPAVTFARAFSETGAGIQWHDVLPFIIAELLGALVGTAVWFAIPAQEKAST